MPKPLQTVTAKWLMENDLPKRPWVVEGLISTGLHILAGEPKVGKSWLVLDMALCVSAGRPLWGFDTTEGTVLYLCLEDPYARIQGRLRKMGEEANENLHFCREAATIDGGLCGQVEEFAAAHEGTILVIVDTLQMVRHYSGESMYMADYSDLSKLKKVADDLGLAMLLVHHRRKMPDDNVFNTVSGSTGITGTADTTMVLYEEGRAHTQRPKPASLAVTGRDTADRKLELLFDETYHWVYLDEENEGELEAERVPREVRAVIEFAQQLEEPWQGLAGELIDDAGIAGTNPVRLGRLLNANHIALAEAGISYARRKTSRGSEIVLSRQP
ncbi:AAA family ATPase [Slackia exigua]|uniref:AAA family ATPase n=1 Tax=Slackia exigua TaxID=84109 RepID=UPI002006B8A8|nr:AAA family ATPase [Slackia exigua]MCK6139728.1 helicase RepA family protein [Slackia exigua]